MLKKLLTFLILILTIFTNSWSFVFGENSYKNNDNILLEQERGFNAGFEKASKELK